MKKGQAVLEAMVAIVAYASFAMLVISSSKTAVGQAAYGGLERIGSLSNASSACTVLGWAGVAGGSMTYGFSYGAGRLRGMIFSGNESVSCSTAIAGGKRGVFHYEGPMAS